MTFWDNNIVQIIGLAKPVGQTGEKESWEELGTKYSGVSVYIEQIPPEVAIAYGRETCFRMYKMFTNEVLDITESDRVIDQDGREYTVQGIRSFEDNLDVQNCQEVTLTAKYDG